ncbi:MAG: hypothetical protein Q3963_04560 [Coriobacteriaceae bacterium]|nr:hypothetical protein [Coriobacteriaceae bacterium]
MNMECINRARNAMLAAILATGLMIPATGVAYAADDESDDTSTKVKDKLNNLFTEEAEDDNTPKKTESVYIFANADGSVKNTVVSNWLKNATEAAKLHDISSLTDIENTEGKETFEARGQSLVWDAQGGDIYYQGKTDKQSPVSVTVTYWLDGKETPAADMAGKSGHVKIRFDYTNNSSSTEYVDGAARTVYTPFVCLTGLILDNGVFKNVKATHAKLINDGDRTMVGGYAMPGLREDLDLDDDTLDIPTYFEIEADAENFEMSTTATIVTSDLFNNVNTDELNDDEISDALNELSDGMGQLLDGTSELYNGMKKLDDGGEKLAAGTAELQEKTADLPDSAEQLADGAGQLADGLTDAGDGVDQLIAGNQAVDSGLKQLKGDEKNGLTYAADASKQLSIGAATIAKGLDILRNGGTAPDGRTSGGLISAVNALSEGGQLLNGVDALQAGAKQAATGAETLENGAGQLEAGSDKLLQGLNVLRNGDGTAENPGLAGAYSLLNNMDLSALDKLAEASAAFQEAGKTMQGVQGQLEAAKSDVEAAAGSASGIGESATAAGNSAQSAGAAAQNAGSSAADAAADAQAVANAANNLAGALNGVDLSGLSDEDRNAVESAVANAASAAADAANSSANAASAAADAATSAGQAATDAGDAATKAGEVGLGAKDALENIGTALQDTATAATTTGAALKQIQEAGSELNVNELKTGVAALKDGLEKAVAGLGDEKTEGTLINGAAILKDGLESVKNGASALKDGNTAIENGLGDLRNGLTVMRDGTETTTGLSDAVDSLGDEKTDDTLINGTTQVKDGLDALGSGLNDAVDGIGDAKSKNTLLYGTDQMDKGLNSLGDGLDSAEKGATQLAGGLDQLNDAVPSLVAGITALKDGSAQLSDGIGAATKGTKKLREGLETFNEEGIQKIIDAYNDNLAGLGDRLKATVEAGKAYNTFTGKADEMQGSVKFILETDAIEISED